MVTGLATHKFTTFKSPSRLVCKSWGGAKIPGLLPYQEQFLFDALSIFSRSQALHPKSQLFLRALANEAPESARLSSSGGLQGDGVTELQGSAQRKSFAELDPTDISNSESPNLSDWHPCCPIHPADTYVKQGSDVARTTSSDEAFGSIETSTRWKHWLGLLFLSSSTRLFEVDDLEVKKRQLCKVKDTHGFKRQNPGMPLASESRIGDTPAPHVGQCKCAAHHLPPPARWLGDLGLDVTVAIVEFSSNL